MHPMTGTRRGPRLLLAAALALLAPAAALAADPPPRVPVARCGSETATLLRREAPDKPWQVVKEKEELLAGDLILGGTDGVIDSRDGGVRLSIVGDMDGATPLPVLETALVLNDPKDADLDLTLQRGRIELVNRKEKGGVVVRLHFREAQGELMLNDPGTRVSVQVLGRWTRGSHFSRLMKPGEAAPTVAALLLVIKGEVMVNTKDKAFALKAPPGPAVLFTENLLDPHSEAQYLEKLPAWAEGQATTERGKKIRAVMKQFQQSLQNKPVTEVLADMVKSPDALERRCAVVLMGATDHLAMLGLVLAESKDAEVWDAAVLALRHWIGREPGQDLRLYEGLVKLKVFKPREAESIVQMLHSFSDDDLSRPETYEVLIDLLESERTSLRFLAAWHLARVVPEGKKIGYDPFAPKEERAKAVAEWRKLIPAGQLPPKPDK
jgi:hypothetical protein